MALFSCISKKKKLQNWSGWQSGYDFLAFFFFFLIPLLQLIYIYTYLFISLLLYHPLLFSLSLSPCFFVMKTEEKAASRKGQRERKALEGFVDAVNSWVERQSHCRLSLPGSYNPPTLPLFYSIRQETPLTLLLLHIIFVVTNSVKGYSQVGTYSASLL